MFLKRRIFRDPFPWICVDSRGSQTSDKPPFSPKNGRYVWSGPDAGNVPSSVNSTPCKTRYQTAVLAHANAWVPQLAGKFLGAEVRFLDDFDVPFFRRHSAEPLQSSSVEYAGAII